MLRRFLHRLDHVIGVASETERDRAHLGERLCALMPRMPWVYAILVINLSGVLISLQNQTPLVVSPGVGLILFMLARLFHWVRLRGSSLNKRDVLRELRRLYVVGALLSGAYCTWLLALYSRGAFAQREHIILFGSLAALGCSHALSPVPGVARMPLYFLALPLAVVLILSGDLAYFGMGFTLGILIVVTLRLNRAEDATFTRLVDARLDTEIEKMRAEQAERSAVADRSTARKLADTDPLTGLANRRAFLAAVGQRASAGAPLAIVLFDLDGFKPVNDTFGHASGDALLIAVAKRLLTLVGGGGVVARLGGDEFALLLDGSCRQRVEDIVAKAIFRIGEPAQHDGRNLIVSACAGIGFADRPVDDPGQLIRMADMALFSAKRSGRGSVEIFSSALEHEVKRRAELELALRSPGVTDDIEIAYQPIVDLATMQVRSFEALARWRHSELGWIPPSEFIPITEQISLVETISEALLLRAAGEAVAWPDATCLSFNLSGVQLCSDGSAERIIELLRDSGLHPSRLQIEVTETAMLVDFDTARRNLSYLRDHGVQLALDDFGAGYASISYLREMHFDAIKLDGSLITSAAMGERGLALLNGVLELCRAVGLPCIAEHVETRAQATMLRELGCRFGQGFWLARPMSAARASRVAQSDVVRVAPGSRAGHWPEGPELLRGRA